MRKQYHFWPGTEGLDAWDIDRLIDLSDGLPIESVDLAEICEIDSVYWFHDGAPPTVREVVEHCRLIDEVDPSYPIILGPDSRVMDGMHRIARALLHGETFIGAVRLDPVPEPDFRACSPDDLPFEADQ